LKSAAERLRRLVRLAPREQRLLIRTWWDFIIVGVGLRWISLPRLLRRRAVTPPRAPVALERLGWLVDVARRCVPLHRNCLNDAVVLARVLGAEGLDATVRIGVTRTGDGLRAHAWVEHHGRPVFPTEHGGIYTPLARSAGE
jgi:hypothetical protein